MSYFDIDIKNLQFVGFFFVFVDSTFQSGVGFLVIGEFLECIGVRLFGFGVTLSVYSFLLRFQRLGFLGGGCFFVQIFGFVVFLKYRIFYSLRDVLLQLQFIDSILYY